MTLPLLLVDRLIARLGRAAVDDLLDTLDAACEDGREQWVVVKVRCKGRVRRIKILPPEHDHAGPETGA